MAQKVAHKFQGEQYYYLRSNIAKVWGANIVKLLRTSQNCDRKPAGTRQTQHIFHMGRKYFDTKIRSKRGIQTFCFELTKMLYRGASALICHLSLTCVLLLIKVCAFRRKTEDSVAVPAHDGANNGLDSELKFQSASLVLLAGVFWVWAIINVVNSGKFDLGVVSFLSVICSAANGFAFSSCNRPRARFCMFAFACFFVVFNYAAGFVVVCVSPEFSSQDTVLLIYFALAAATWSMAGIWVLFLGKRKTQLVENASHLWL